MTFAAEKPLYGTDNWFAALPMLNEVELRTELDKVMWQAGVVATLLARSGWKIRADLDCMHYELKPYEKYETVYTSEVKVFKVKQLEAPDNPFGDSEAEHFIKSGPG